MNSEHLPNACPNFFSQIKLEFISHIKHFEQNLNRKSEVYQEQETLNEEFNAFVRNYQEAYFGANTAKYQIHSTVDKAAYSDPGEELPLGPNFQRLVKCFSRYIECYMFIPVYTILISISLSHIYHLRPKVSKGMVFHDRSHLISVKVYENTEVLLRQLE